MTQPTASTIYASVIRIEGCSPMYGMAAKDPIHATMAMTSEMRKVICVGALSLGMFAPKKSWK